CAIDGLLDGVDVLLCRESSRQRDVPHVAVAMIVGGAAAGIPGPLVHGHEMDALIALDERLRAVAMVHVPVDDEHAVEPARATRIVRRDCDVAEEAESHR